MTAEYTYLWEYLVAPGQVGAFQRAYGPSGEWVRLFRRSPGYIRTELYRDRSNPRRFVTIDHWESQAAWEAFRSRFADEFSALDAKCEQWTASEAEIGRFEPVE